MLSEKVTALHKQGKEHKKTAEAMNVQLETESVGKVPFRMQLESTAEYVAGRWL